MLALHNCPKMHNRHTWQDKVDHKITRMLSPFERVSTSWTEDSRVVLSLPSAPSYPTLTIYKSLADEEHREQI